MEDQTINAWKNGAEYMRGEIIELLTGMKGTALGVTRSTLADAIERIKRLEVRT